MENRQDVKSLTHEELSQQIQDMGLPRFRCNQIEQWLWIKGVSSFDEMTNLSKELRSQLAERYCLSSAKMVVRQESFDGTCKYLFEFQDGTQVEAVGIPSEDRSHLSVCFSTQAGCSMGCSFCATGLNGFTRNLSIGEMFDQVRIVGQNFGRRVSNVVAMGQGEPFLNYSNTIGALRLINDSKVGLGVGARHITVSTCGILNGIERFAAEPEQFTLAVSLHSAIQETRDALMPGVSNVLLKDLKSILKDYGDTTKRRPSLEYAPIDGVNDDERHIDALVEFCSNMLTHVNLIPLNLITDEDEQKGMLRPSPRIEEIEAKLYSLGIETSIRKSRGSDIDGACGQLRQRFH